MQVTETTINLKGHCACMIERQAPYCAMIKHSPPPNLIMPVNTTNGTTVCALSYCAHAGD
jgi:hypothetical protein